MGNKSDRLMLIVRLLDAVNRNPSRAVTRQSNAANINLGVAKRFFDILELRGFLRKIPLGKDRFNYHITNKGLDLLNQINRCYEAIEDKPTIGVLQFA